MEIFHQMFSYTPLNLSVFIEFISPLQYMYVMSQFLQLDKLEVFF